MQVSRIAGRGAATQKYDLLTILGTYALSQDNHLQRRTLRLICLITARYNWQNDQLSVGQEEIARLWSVDPRTVKREMAQFRACGWLVEKRAAARGRVTLYGLGIARILTDTRAVWDKVGPDLVERLSQDDPAPRADQTVIPFPQAPLPAEGRIWPDLARLLQAENPGQFRAWFAPLSVRESADLLTLVAPSSFHASYLRTHHAGLLQTALSRVAPGMRLRIDRAE